MSRHICITPQMRKMGWERGCSYSPINQYECSMFWNQCISSCVCTSEACSEYQNLTLQSGSRVFLSSEFSAVPSTAKGLAHSKHYGISLTEKKKSHRSYCFFPVKILKSCTEPPSLNGLTIATIISLYIFKSWKDNY